jgi:hypothetical protein
MKSSVSSAGEIPRNMEVSELSHGGTTPARWFQGFFPNLKWRMNWGLALRPRKTEKNNVGSEFP